MLLKNLDLRQVSVDSEMPILGQVLSRTKLDITDLQKEIINGL